MIDNIVLIFYKVNMGLPKRLTDMQRKFAQHLILHEGKKFAWECAKEAGYGGDKAMLRKKASELQSAKIYPLVVKHIGELREEVAHKYQITVGRHLSELAKIRDEAIKHRSFSAATNAEVNRGKVGGFYIEQKVIRTGKIEDMSEEELDKRLVGIVSDNAPLLKHPKKEKPEELEHKKPKLPLK
tara:strand:- start:51 stop:602 length:552 start_codon:yes stop_codon:yes gene_type:complete